VVTLGTIAATRIKTRQHLTRIRYALSVELDQGEPAPVIGDTFRLGDMGVVRVVALPKGSRLLPGSSNDRERSFSVETLETIGRLANLP